jgi:hypothetical protein
MIRCLCIDAQDRPSKIPEHKWLEEGKEYTLAFSMTVLPQKKLAFQLNEIDLDDSCSPYTWFLARRFAFRQEDLESLIEFIKECNQVTLSLKDLMRETNERKSDTVQKD